MIILGINAYHGDAAAVLLVDGQLVCAVEEERFRRVKHWAGFPTEAIRWCLEFAGVEPQQVDHIAVSRNPQANVLRKVLFTLKRRPSFDLVADRLRNAGRVRDIRQTYCEAFGLEPNRLKATVHPVEHHLAHLASAFFVSPYEDAAVASIDGFGDFVSTMWGSGHGPDLRVTDRTFFPHSLGLLYLAVTQYLGFPKYGDEYKVMGLAAYGEPVYLEKLRRVIRCLPEGRFELDLDYFRHHSEGVAMTWDDGAPTMGPVYSDALEQLLGPARKPDEAVTQHHQDVAASLQAVYEEVAFHILNRVHERTGSKRLCLAGGCGMNSVANGKVFARTPFEDIFIQPAAGDNGTALGAAFHVWHQVLGQPRSFQMTHAYWGPAFDSNAVLAALLEAPELAGCVDGAGGKFQVERIADQGALVARTAEAIADGKIVGWFQGRMEWGARALGNRSILADPRRKEMREILNAKIKFREKFRPFAPSILLEAVPEYFTIGYPDPFMIKVYPVREEKRDVIPAVTHVDGTGRLQTVTATENPLYYRLIAAFRERTGVPLVLNTSFNENEPICCKPAEALDCFLRTNMDVLVMQDWWVARGKS